MESGCSCTEVAKACLWQSHLVLGKGAFAFEEVTRQQSGAKQPKVRAARFAKQCHDQYCQRAVVARTAESKDMARTSAAKDWKVGGIYYGYAE